MAFSTSYTFGFSAVICVTCSLAVALAAQTLREKQETNVRRDVQGAILSALGVEGLSGPAVDEAYESRVRCAFINGAGDIVEEGDEDIAMTFMQTELALELGKNGTLSDEDMATYREEALLPVFSLVDNGNVQAYALPLMGMGLWGPISGYLAIEPNAATVVGATFFAPKETPGLGHEITAAPFLTQFPTKSLFTADGDLEPIEVVKGAVELKCPGRTEHCVRGVSGATMTSNGVDAMLAGALTAYEPYLATLRAGGNG